MQIRAVGILLAAAVGVAACSDTTAPRSPVVPLARMDPTTKSKLVTDAEQPAVGAGLSPLALYPLDTDPGTFGEFKENLAQTFTATASETLEFLGLPIACQSGVFVRLQIKSGSPDGTLLFDRTYDPAKPFADGTFLWFQIYGGVSLTGGGTYAFVLSSDITPGTCSIVRGPAGDSYSGGEGFLNNPGFTPYWVSFSVFGPGESWDLPFRTLVR